MYICCVRKKWEKVNTFSLIYTLTYKYWHKRHFDSPIHQINHVIHSPRTLKRHTYRNKNVNKPGGHRFLPPNNHVSSVPILPVHRYASFNSYIPWQHVWKFINSVNFAFNCHHMVSSYVSPIMGASWWVDIRCLYINILSTWSNCITCWPILHILPKIKLFTLLHV